MSFRLKKILVLVGLGLLAQQSAQSQGEVNYFSNLSGPSIGAITNASQWTGFITGNNSGGYILNGIQLGMSDSIGTPDSFSVSVYQRTNFSGAGANPSDASYVGSLSGFWPLKAGVYSYTPTSEIFLLPNSDYVLSESGSGNGSFAWSMTHTSYSISSGGWSGGGYLVSPQFAIFATPIPEPSVGEFFVLGGLCFLIFRLVRTINNSIKRSV